MEKEGQTPEQTLAPISDAAPEAVSNVPVVETPPAAETPANTADQAPRKRFNKNKCILIAFTIAAAALVIAGLSVLVVNLNNGNGGGDNGSFTTAEIESEASRIKEESDIDAMITYVDNVFETYNNGSSHQNLTKEEVAELYGDFKTKLIIYIGQNQDQRNKYISIIIKYAYAAEDLLHSADTAAGVYYAEYYYGNKEVAKQYKQIAIERGSKAFEFNPDGQG